MCVHLLVNITDLLGLLKKCRCNGQLCALDERIACRILLEKYFEILVWIQDGLNVLRTLLNGTFFH
jgi:Fe2+ transport system protein B